MEGHALCTLGSAHGAQWVDEQHILFANGNGLVRQHLETGSQVHLWGTANRHLGGSGGTPLFCCNPAGRIAALTQNGADASIYIVSTADLSLRATFTKDGSKELSWHALSFSHDGNVLASVSAFPDPVFDLWDTSACKGSGKVATSGNASLSSMCHVRLGPRLSSLDPVFFPFNSNVVAVAGQQAVRVIAISALMGGHTMKQADVDVSLLHVDEHLTSMAWAPTGALLLGTSTGRLLSVSNAAPSGVIEHHWGIGDLSLKATVLYVMDQTRIADLLTNHLLSSDKQQAIMQGLTETKQFYSPKPESAVQGTLSHNQSQTIRSTTGKVDAIYCLQGHILLACDVATPMTSNDSKQQLQARQHTVFIWLNADTWTPTVIRTLPGSAAMTYSLSPDVTTLLLTNQDGDLLLADSMIGIQPNEQTNNVEHGVSAMIQLQNLSLDQPGDGDNDSHLQNPLQNVVNTHLIASSHAGRASTVLLLPGKVVVTGGQDGMVKVWNCRTTTSTKATDAATTGSQQQPNFALTTELIASWSLGAPITQMVNYMDTQVFAVGTASGQLHILSVQKLMELLNSGRFADLPVSQPMSHIITAAATATTPEDGSYDEVKDAMKPVWAQQPFEGAITSIAFTAEGTLCAVCSASGNMIAFYKVASIGTTSYQVSLHFQGFYTIACPQLLAFSPKDARSHNTAPAPLLVVSTTNGELQVLKPPDSLSHLKKAAAMIPTNSLLVALLRVSSVITAMVTQPAQLTGCLDDVGSFWLFFCCTDKSIRRLRLPTQQHKAAAQAAIAAAEQSPRSLSRQESSFSQQHKRLSTLNALSAPMAVTAPQNFQVPETERSQDLASPACHVAISGNGQALVLTTQCGTTYVYTLPDLGQVVKWQLHAPLPIEETAVSAPLCMLTANGDVVAAPPPSQSLQHAKAGASALSQNLLATVGVDGCVQVVLLSGEAGVPRPRRPASSRTGAHLGVKLGNPQVAMHARMSAPPGLDCLIPGAGAVISPPPQYQPLHRVVPERVLTWREVAVQANSAAAAAVKASSEVLASKTAAWSEKLKELRKRNDETDDGKLEPCEFVIDRQLQQQLLTEGQAKISAMKAIATRQCVEPQIVHGRLVTAVLQNVEVSARHEVLAALPEHSFISPLSVEDLKRWREQAPHVAALLKHGVTSYPIRKLSPQEEKMLRKVKYLRLMEQAEMSSWPAEGRGQVACIKRWHGPMVSAIRLTRGVSSVGASQQPTPRVMTRQGTLAPPQSGTDNAIHDESEDELDIENENVAIKVSDEHEQDTTIQNGVCQLLYSPLQLHCMTRKAAQAALLMEEIRAVQRAFNDRFTKLRARKTADIDRLMEKAGRIAEIQKALKATPPPYPDYYYDSLEKWHDKLTVHDSEVQVPRWVSPEERVRREAAAKHEEEARLRAQADDARQRALRDMMNANPEVRPVLEEEEGLKREGWMDLPRTQLTAEQRAQLTEWEKAVAEAEEKQEKTRIALEAERKGLELEMADIVMEFNHQLAGLASTRDQVDTNIKSLELQALDCALAHEGVQTARDQAQQLAAQREAAASDQKRHARLAVSARAALQHAYKEYETLAAQERALDKAVKRELGSKDEDVWEIVQRIYKDRSRPVRPGNPSRPAAELLGKIPEAAAVSKLSQELMQHGSTVQEMVPWTSVSENTVLEPPCLLEMTHWQRNVLTTYNSSGQDEQINDMQAVQQQCSGLEQTTVLTDILNRKHIQRAANAHSFASEYAGRILNAGQGRPESGDKIQRATAAVCTGQDSNAPMSHLETLTRMVGHRSLSPALSQLAQGQPVRSLLDSGSVQGVILPQATVTQACNAFNPPPESAAATATQGQGAATSQHTSSIAKISTHTQHVWHDQQCETGPPYSLADKPHHLEEVWWLRLMDMRDARIQLEKDADTSWGRLAWAALLCDLLEQEEHINGGKLDDLSEALSLLPHITEKCLLDVLLTYRLQNGQVEVPCPGDSLLANTGSALLLHRWHVERANTAVQDAGADKLTVLQDIKGLAASIYTARWGVARAELRRTHARAELTDLQLLHVTKDLQAVLRDPSALTRLDAAKQLEGRISASAASHASKIGLKAMELTKLTQRLAQTAREHHDLEGATVAAQAAAEESKRVRGVIARADVEQENAHKRAFRAIVENSQLKDIAASQAAELASLAKELNALRGRIFPMLADKPRPISALPGGPDLHQRFAGIPSVRAEQQLALQRPYSVPASKSRPMWKTASPPASRPSSGVMLKSVSRALEPLKPGTARGSLAPLMTTVERGNLPPRPNSVAAAMSKLQNDSGLSNIARPDSIQPLSLLAAGRPQSVGPVTRANNITHISRPSSVPLGRRRQE